MSLAARTRPAVAGIGWAPLLWGGLWLALVAVAVATRPPLPVDETRYLSVAWEMWLRGDLLVPHLNGETYSHKPPLLFWLMQAGWALFGVGETWPRLVAPVFGLAALALSAHLAGRLWPDRPQVRALAPLLVLGALFWTLFTTLTMFDMMLAALALLGIAGVVTAWRGAGARGWALAGVAIGLGVLAKGPAILLHVLPVALLAPWWDTGGRIRAGSGWGRWYGGAALAVLLGAAIGLAWAVPAALAGGDAYANAIFWGQTAGRMVESFAHQRPLWWFAAILPVMLLPWTVWPAAWRAAAGARRAWADPGLRLCAAWFVPAFVIFSLVSGKQPHYLLPEFPALALGLAFLMDRGEVAPRRWGQLVPGLTFAALAVALGLIPVVDWHGLPDWADRLPGGWAILALSTGLSVAFAPPRGLAGTVAGMAAMSAAAVLSLHLIAAPALETAYDLRPLARALGGWQAEGRPIAVRGNYHGQFQFLGRLRAPVAELRDAEAVVAWARAHPDGRLVSEHDTRAAVANAPVAPLMVQAYRSDVLAVWPAAAVAADPSLIAR